MKYILIVFYLTSHWPMPAQIHWAQLGPYNSILACEKAAVTAQAVVTEIGAERVGTFCSETKTNWRVK